MSEEVRREIYRVLAAISPLFVAYGIISDEEAGLWVAAISAVLGLSNLLAFRNTPKNGKHEA